MSDTGSSFLEGFKVVYGDNGDAFKKQQNLLAKTWAKIPVSPLKPSKKGTSLPVEMSGNEIGGAMNPGESFGVPGAMNPQSAVVLPKEYHWPFAVEGSLIALSEGGDKVAFGSAVENIMQSVAKRFTSDVNRGALGKGTGQLSLANGAGTAATALIVDNAIPFRRGMVLDSFVSIGGAKEIGAVTPATITAVDYTTNTLTITPAQTWSDNSIIVKNKVQDGAPVGGKEVTGLQAICDTTAYSTTFESLVVASNPEWVGNVIDASGAPISHDLLRKSLARGRTIGGASPTNLISNEGQARNFENTELQKTRYEPTKIDAGVTTLRWNELEWMIEKDYDLNEVGMYDMENVFKIQTKDIHLNKLKGSDFYQISGKDAISGYYSYYGNMGTWKRNAHIRLTNLAEPTF